MRSFYFCCVILCQDDEVMLLVYREHSSAIQLYNRIMVVCMPHAVWFIYPRVVWVHVLRNEQYNFKFAKETGARWEVFDGVQEKPCVSQHISLYSIHCCRFKGI